MCRKAAFDQNRKGVGTGEIPFDRKQQRHWKPARKSRGLGMPGPMGTSGQETGRKMYRERSGWRKSWN